MCHQFEVEWLKELIREQVISLLELGVESIMLRCLQIAEDIDIESIRSTVYGNLYKISLVNIKKSDEYQYLSYVARDKIIKYKVAIFESLPVEELQRLFGLLDEMFIQKTEDLKLAEDPHDAHGPRPQIE